MRACAFRRLRALHETMSADGDAGPGPGGPRVVPVLQTDCGLLNTSDMTSRSRHTGDGAPKELPVDVVVLATRDVGRGERGVRFPGAVSVYPWALGRPGAPRGSRYADELEPALRPPASAPARV